MFITKYPSFFRGNGDGHFSSLFQTALEGNQLHNASMPRDLAYGKTQIPETIVSTIFKTPILKQKDL